MIASAPTDPNPAIAFSPFVIKKTGFLQSQTILKIDVYSLICIPYQISAERILLLVSLSKDEIVFFQKFNGSLAGLTLMFQLSNSPEPLKLFARCAVLSLAPMKGRDNAAIITAAFKPCPQDLTDILSTYQQNLEKLRAEYGDYRDKVVKVSPETAKAMGFNNYAILTQGGASYKFSLYALAANKLEFLLPLSTPDLTVGSDCLIKLFFQKYQFQVKGKIDSASRLPTGVLKAGAEIEFSPELVEILEGYFFSQRMAEKRAQDKA
jgi:hypothetical protein